MWLIFWVYHFLLTNDNLFTREKKRSIINKSWLEKKQRERRRFDLISDINSKQLIMITTTLTNTMFHNNMYYMFYKYNKNEVCKKRNNQDIDGYVSDDDDYALQRISEN